MQFEDHHEEEHIECELQGGDRISGQDPLFRVNNLPVTFSSSQNIRSGETTLYAPGAKVIDNLGVLFIPTVASIEMVSYIPSFARWFHLLYSIDLMKVFVTFLSLMSVPVCVVSLPPLTREMCW